jgi:hypothetical protein
MGLAGVLAGMAALGDATVRPVGFLALLGLATALYAGAAWWVLRRPPAGRGAVALVLGAAVAFRLILLAAPPSLSTDVYRYLWDGRVSRAGISPYRHPPTAPELTALRDATVYPQLNRADWRTIYPPGAQLLFARLAALDTGDGTAFRAAMAALDLGAAVLLLGWLRRAGQPAVRVLLYAWHPLVLVELAGNGHLDAAVVAAVVASLWAATGGRAAVAGVCLGAATLLKLYPALLLPVIARARPGRALAGWGAVVATGYGLYAPDGLAVLGSLGRFATEEHFNGGLPRALAWLLAPLGAGGTTLARLVPAAVLAAVVVAAARGPAPAGVAARARLVGGAFLLTTPILYPWYGLWLVPVLAVAPAWPWLYLTSATGLAYVLLAQPVWHLPPWVAGAELGPPIAGLLLARAARVWPPRPGGLRDR